MELVDYRSAIFILCSYNGWTDTIDNITYLKAHNHVYENEFNGNNPPMLLRPELKSLTLKKVLVNNYTQPVDLFSILMLDLFQRDALVSCH